MFKTGFHYLTLPHRAPAWRNMSVSGDGILVTMTRKELEELVRAATEALKATV